MSKIGRRPSLFNFYQQNNSLLFQFILSELIGAYRIVRDVDQILQDFKNTSLRPSSREDAEELFDTLKSHIGKLGGSSQDYMRFFSWNEDGILAKLKNICAFFLQNQDVESKDAQNLHRFSHRAWLLCLRSLDIMRLMEHEYILDNLRKSKPLSSHYELLLQTLEKIKLSVQRMTRIIARLITLFRDDENVIFFLLRYKEQLNELYGPKFVIKLIIQMYPAGLKEASDFLLKKYANRGFDNLLPIIASKISELEAAQQ